MFLNLGKGANGTALVDYISAIHKGPVILPAQVLVEFWNNHLSATEAFAERLSKKFQEVNRAITEIEPAYTRLKDGADALAKEFMEDFGHVLSPTTRTELLALLQVLSTRALFAQVGREAFESVVRSRRQCKIPPAFRDEGDGDFFVWVELLDGLLLAQEHGQRFDQVVLVTDDVKKDWSTGGAAHPVLVGEVHALVGVPFCTMTLGEFRAAAAELGAE